MSGLDTTGPKYGFDFLDTIVAVSFPSKNSGYILVTVTATNTAQTANAPSPPSVDIFIGRFSGASLVDVKSKVSSVIHPPTHTVNKTFFMWMGAAVFPTLDDFGTIVTFGDQGTPVPYGGQFSMVVDFNATGFRPSHPPGSNPNSGTYVSLAAAQAAAAFVNAAHPGSQTISWFPSDVGAPVAGPVGFPGFFGTEIDETVTTPGSATTTIVKQFLIKVPKSSAFTATVTENGNSVASVVGYSKGTFKTIAQALAGAGDTTARANINGGSGAYAITSQIVGTPSSNNVTMIGSGGGGGGIH